MKTYEVIFRTERTVRVEAESDSSGDIIDALQAAGHITEEAPLEDLLLVKELKRFTVNEKRTYHVTAASPVQAELLVVNNPPKPDYQWIVAVPHEDA